MVESPYIDNTLIPPPTHTTMAQVGQAPERGERAQDVGGGHGARLLDGGGRGGAAGARGGRDARGDVPGGEALMDGVDGGVGRPRAGVYLKLLLLCDIYACMVSPCALAKVSNHALAGKARMKTT